MTPNLCKPWEHGLSRRQLLGGLAGTGCSSLFNPLLARELEASEKQVLFIWLDGGISQLESWDPKPNTRFGGPYRSIPSAIPGIHVSELMPKMAKRMDQLTVVRSVSTQDNNHSSGVPRMLQGDPANRGVTYPFFGSAVAKLLGPCKSGLPPYIWVKPGSGGFKSVHAGFLGPKYGALAFGEGEPPGNLVRPETITADSDDTRNALRVRLNERFARGRRPQVGDAQAHVYNTGHTLMEKRHLFDATSLPEKDLDRYGRNDLGKHLLVARNMIEAGVRFVQVTSYGWDTHGDNFNAHASMVPKFDQAFAMLLDDLRERGMLENVLVVAMSEFGRTPRVNGHGGRDHWAEAWSMAMAGCGLQAGAVIGSTDKEGVFVNDQGYDVGHLFHTWYHALGIDSLNVEFMNRDQPLPIAHHEMFPIKEALA
jgi:hypothetical protein